LIIINRTEGETIDRMVKRYKRKHRKVKLLKNLKARKTFTKKSVARRNEILGARHRFEKFGAE